MKGQIQIAYFLCSCLLTYILWHRATPPNLPQYNQETQILWLVSAYDRIIECYVLEGTLKIL